MYKNQSGQIAIVILLIMVVLLTVGLSLASRTTQEVFLSQQEAESTRVFNAAESGIEDALSQDFSAISAETTLADIGVADVTTTTKITPQGVLETQITEGSTVHLDLSANFGGNTIGIEWSRVSGCDSSASIIASTYYDDSGTTKAVHEAFGPASPCTGSRDTDDFTQVAVDSGSDGYIYRETITLPANPLFMRIKTVYNDTPLRVTGAEASNQFFVIRAEADNDLGDENRAIEVGRGLSTAPSFMDYSVYSGGALAQ
jgi:Tfp pilus assembly protein PilX